MNKFVILVILLISLSLTEAIRKRSKNPQTDQDFQSFKTEYNKHYETESEEIYRYSIFKENQREIEELNSQNYDITYAINQYSDLTDEEFLSQNGGMQQFEEGSDNSEPPVEFIQVDLEQSTNYDLRQYYATNIRNEGSCGASYAFAPIATLEYQHFRRTGQKADLSEQEIIDCGGQNGCGGGYLSSTFDFLQRNNGINNESTYQYTGVRQQCQQRNPKTARISSYTKVSDNLQQIKQAVATIGPVTVCVDISKPSFKNYKSGIYSDTAFQQSSLCSYAGAIYGYGQNSNGTPYIIVRLSMGQGFGEGGYINLDARQYPNGNFYGGFQLNNSYYPILV